MSPPATAPCTISEADFRALARDGLLPEPSPSIFDPRTGRSWGASDFDLNPELIADLAVMDPPRPAAVLVPVVRRAALTVLLTQRTSHLALHAGQIAFPGGKIDGSAETPVAAALREAREEVGLDPAAVEPLGYLDGYRTGTGFHVMPVVALIDPGFSLSPNPTEVAEAFEVPLGFLMDPVNHQLHTRPWRGRERYFYAMPFGERYIWGATAGILKNMHQRLFAR
jgi:8-oxo-dGTP pyrophosphatase MutT (NUDIX family)